MNTTTEPRQYHDLTHTPVRLREAARRSLADWRNVNFAARPYLDAMASLSSVNDRFGFDDARSIVRYFLCNAGSWRGPVAKEIKATLKSML